MFVLKYISFNFILIYFVLKTIKNVILQGKFVRICVA